MSGFLERAIILHDQFLEMESIPSDEREKIIADIDSEMNRSKLKISDTTFRFSSSGKDGALPFIINLSALILLIFLGIYSFQRFKANEESLISRSRALNLTESRIIKRIQRESQQMLSEKNREIETIQSDMDRLQEEQSLLIMASRAEIKRLENALMEELDRQFHAEEEKLKAGGLDPAVLEQRLKDLKTRLDADFLKSQEELIRRVEEKQLRKENELLAEIEDFKDSLQTAEAERDLLLEELTLEQARQEDIWEEEKSELQELRRISVRNRNEEFILNQISVSYKQIAEAISRGDYPRAESGIASLENLIEREDSSDYPGLDSRKAADRLLLNALSTLIRIPVRDTELVAAPSPPFLDPGLSSREEKLQELIARGHAHYEAGEEEQSREAYLEAFALFPPVREGYNRLRTMDISAERQRMYAEGYTRINEEQRLLMEQAVRGRELREELMSGLDRIRLALEEEERSASGQEELIEMLRMKVLLKEVLVSKAVREEYPDLTRTLERYLQSYGILKESSGRSLILMDINDMMEALNSGRPYLPAGGDELQTGLYLAFLEQLRSVLSAPE